MRCTRLGRGLAFTRILDRPALKTRLGCPRPARAQPVDPARVSPLPPRPRRRFRCARSRRRRPFWRASLAETAVTSAASSSPNAMPLADTVATNTAAGSCTFGKSHPQIAEHPFQGQLDDFLCPADHGVPRLAGVGKPPCPVDTRSPSPSASARAPPLSMTAVPPLQGDDLAGAHIGLQVPIPGAVGQLYAARAELTQACAQACQLARQNLAWNRTDDAVVADVQQEPWRIRQFLLGTKHGIRLGPGRRAPAAPLPADGPRNRSATSRKTSNTAPRSPRWTTNRSMSLAACAWPRETDPVEGHRGHVRPEPVAHLGHVHVEQRFQVGVSVTPILAGRRHRKGRVARTCGRRWYVCHEINLVSTTSMFMD